MAKTETGTSSGITRRTFEKSVATDVAATVVVSNPAAAAAASLIPNAEVVTTLPFGFDLSKLMPYYKLASQHPFRGDLMGFLRYELVWLHRHQPYPNRVVTNMCTAIENNDFAAVPDTVAEFFGAERRMEYFGQRVQHNIAKAIRGDDSVVRRLNQFSRTHPDNRVEYWKLHDTLIAPYVGALKGLGIKAQLESLCCEQGMDDIRMKRMPTVDERVWEFYNEIKECYAQAIPNIDPTVLEEKFQSISGELIKAITRGVEKGLHTANQAIKNLEEQEFQREYEEQSKTMTKHQKRRFELLQSLFPERYKNIDGLHIFLDSSVEQYTRGMST